MSDGEAHGSVEIEGKLQEDIPDTAVNAMVPLDALDKVNYKCFIVNSNHAFH